MTESLNYAREKAAALNLEACAASASNGVMNDGQIDWLIANLHNVNKLRRQQAENRELKARLEALEQLVKPSLKR